MMHRLKDKKIKLYLYFFLLISMTSIFNKNFFQFFKKKFTIDEIQYYNSNIIPIETNYLLNKSIFKIDKKIFNNLLQDNPILDSFEIKKIYPNKLNIKFIKSQPIAQIYNKKSNLYLGENKKIFTDYEKYNSLLIINGKIDVEIISKIIKMIDKSTFNKKEINEIFIFPSNGFDIKLNNNIIFKFPDKLSLKLIERAFYIYTKSNFKEKIYDFRLSNKLILKNE